MVIEDIVRSGVNLETLQDLIRRMQVENRIGRQSRCLIGLIADEILAAYEQRIASHLERVGDRIIEAGLDAIAGDRGDSVARQDLDVAVGVGKRAMRTDVQGIEKSRIDQRITGV